MKQLIILSFSYFILFITALGINNLTAQDSLNKWEHQSHLKLVELELGTSYITAPWDQGNIEDLKFEINSNPSFVIFDEHKTHLMATISPQIIIRMFNERSLPVRTPSYMPHLTFYYNKGNFQKKKMNAAFIRYCHHSNGQQDSTIFYDGEINVKSGDFTTNFLEFGWVHTFNSAKINKLIFLESSFEYHLKNLTQKQILGSYSLYRWNNHIIITTSPEFFNNKGKLMLDARINWLFGNMNDWSILESKRLNLDISLFYIPPYLNEVGFFIKYYQGMDYYNIYYDHHLSMFRFGIMAHVLRP
jgi:hypothetical protein